MYPAKNINNAFVASHSSALCSLMNRKYKGVTQQQMSYEHTAGKTANKKQCNTPSYR
mgnify:CR=1 FL=1